MSDTLDQRETSAGDATMPEEKADASRYETMRGCLALAALAVIAAVASVALIVIFGSHVS